MIHTITLNVYVDMQMAYEASLREAKRLLEEYTTKLQKGQVIKDGAFDDDQHRIIGGRVGLLLQVNFCLENLYKCKTSIPQILWLFP